MNLDSTAPYSTDEELIRNLQQDDRNRRKTEELLFNRHMYFIRDGMHRYSIPEEDAFDAYSDSILQGIDNISRGLFEKRASIKTYLFRIFNNKCVDHIRKKTTNKNVVHQTAPLSGMLDMISDPAKNVVQQLVERSDLDALKLKVKELGENCRKLLEWFSEGFSDKEIATHMEYKTGDVVKTSRLRCLDKLRKSFMSKKEGNG